jgi:hypothetical protein
VPVESSLACIALAVLPSLPVRVCRNRRRISPVSSDQSVRNGLCPFTGLWCAQPGPTPIPNPVLTHPTSPELTLDCAAPERLGCCCCSCCCCCSATPPAASLCTCGPHCHQSRRRDKTAPTALCIAAQHIQDVLRPANSRRPAHAALQPPLDALARRATRTGCSAHCAPLACLGQPS